MPAGRAYPEVTVLNHPYPGESLKKHGMCRGKFLKAVCDDPEKLVVWARENGIPVSWIHRSRRGVYHIDLWGAARRKVEKRGLFK